MPKINWSEFTWPISSTCTCANCGTKFRSHAKFQDGGLWSKDPCPSCEGHRLCGVEGDPEEWGINAN